MTSDVNAAAAPSLRLRKRARGSSGCGPVGGGGGLVASRRGAVDVLRGVRGSSSKSQFHPGLMGGC